MQAGSAGRTLSAGGVTLNLDERTVTADGQRVALTYKGVRAAAALPLPTSVAFTRDQLSTTLWGMDYCGETRTVDMHIRTLRQKLGRWAA